MKKKCILKSKRSYLTVILAFILLITGLFRLGSYIIDVEKKAMAGASVHTQIAPAGSEKVLYLSSYDAGFYAFDEDKENILQILNANGYDCDIMCMDAKLFASDDDIQKFHDLMKQRLSEETYVGMIVSDDQALKFAMTYEDELFPDIPITYFGINDMSLAEKASASPLIAGYFEDSTCISETIDLAVRLLPEADQVVGIYDNTITGFGAVREFSQISSQYPDLNFTALNFSDYTADEFKGILSGYGGDTILLAMSAYLDRDGQYYKCEQAASLIGEAAAIPVFYFSAGGFDSGYTAGVYMNFGAMAKQASEHLVSALNGETSYAGLNTPMSPEDFHQYVYNYRKMKEYHLDTDVFPENTRIVDPAEGFWSSNYHIILPMIMILAGLVLFIVYLKRMYKRSRRNETELEKAMNESKASRKELEWRAEHDALTGLYNWHTALSRIARFSDTNTEKYAVILFDIDNFKLINETYGHDSGDDVLRVLTDKLKRICEYKNMFLSRYGGDEFMILVKGKWLDEDAEELVSLRRVFREPILLGDDQIVPACSLGIANSYGQKDAEKVIMSADIALTHAKRSGKDLSAFYSEDMKQEVDTELSVKAAIVDAAENDGFRMVYQPQVNTMTGEIYGYEALIRMTRSNLSPGDFIPIAESSGWIRTIGRITTEKTIRQLAAWRDSGAELHPVSINFSFLQISDKQYVSFLKDLLKKYDIAPSLVELEITERFFMDSTKQSSEMLKQITDMGIKLLLDDFGTGYSSLSSLYYIPVSYVKIDKSFVDHYLVKGNDSFIRDVIIMAHDIGKKVIVEGVETKEQYLRLKAFHADIIQGYYFSKPLDPENIPAFRAKLPE